MDQLLLQSFNNLSVALQNLADALEKNKEKEGPQESMIQDAFANTGIADQIKMIDAGVKQIIESNTEILASQKSVLENMQKSAESKAKEEGEELSTQKKVLAMVQDISKKQDEDSKKLDSIASATDKKEKGPLFMDKKKTESIKDGLAVIVLMAGAILAIGYAFSLIGKVDFLSVIALSIALPLLAIAVQKISERKVELGSLKNGLIAIGLLSIVMVGVSYLFSKMATITIAQGVTAILIAGVFAVLGYSIAKITEASDEVVLAGLIIMPFVMTLTSLAILGSSYLLSKVKPISIAQGLTAILIAGTFAVISFAISEITGAASDVAIDGLILMPLVLTLTSLAILGSSYLLSKVKPITLAQGLTSIAIGITFAAIALSIAEILKGLEGANEDAIIIMPIALIATSFAIMASSALLAMVTTISFSQFLTSLGIAIVFVPLAFSLVFISRAFQRLSIPKIIATSVALPVLMIAMSAAIMASSMILNKTQIVEQGLLFNIVLQAIALSAVAIALSLSIFALDKMGLASAAGIKKAVAAGLVILAIAGTIALASGILAMGNYTNAPSLDWTLGAGASILAFGLLIGAVGAVLMSSGFILGALAGAAGAVAILGIAKVIVETDKILSKGNYRIYPKLDWALGVGASLLAFALVMAATGAAIAASFGLGAVAGMVGAKAVLAIAQVIVDTDGILSQGKYERYPSLTWIASVSAIFASMGVAIAAAALLLPGVILGSLTVLAIAGTIYTVDKLLSTGDYNKFPSMGYLGSVGILLTTVAAALVAAAPLLPGVIIGGLTMLAVAGTIYAVDKLLSTGDYNKFPSMDYLGSVGILLTTVAVSLVAAAPLLLGVIAGGLTLLAVAGTIYAVDKLLSKGDYTKFPSKEYMTGVTSTLKEFSNVMLEYASSIFGLLAGAGSVALVSESIKNTSLTLAAGDYSKTVTEEWSIGTKRGFEEYAKISEVADTIDGSNIPLIERTAASIAGISLIINSGIYTKIISQEYNESLLSAFKYYSKLLENVSIFDPLLSGIAINTATSIADISLEINRGDYSKTIPRDWGANVAALFSGYKKITEVVESMNPNFFSRAITAVGNTIADFFGLERKGPEMTPESVAANIVALSKIISMGDYKTMPKDWMDSVYENMKSYFKILDLLDGQGMSTEILGVTISIGRGISRMASDYEKLAAGIQKVSAAINSIDIDKVTGLRALTGSVVLLSLMDADQFEDVMDALEEKSEILGNILDKASEAGQSGLPSVRQPVAITNEGPGMNDIIGLIRQIDSKLGAIASSNSNISSYVNEIRSSPTKVGLRK
jgi:hypothetical protein